MIENLMTQLQPLIINAAITILTAVATYVGVMIKNFVQDKVNSEEKKKIVETTCRYINQIYKDVDGPTKFEKAKENILQQLNEKGINITDLELEVLIESTVNSFKDGLNSKTKEEPKEKTEDKKDNELVGK